MIEATQNCELKGRGIEIRGTDFLVKRDTIPDRCWELSSNPALAKPRWPLIQPYNRHTFLNVPIS